MRCSSWFRTIFLSTMILCFSASAWAEKITIRADEWFPYNGSPARGKTGYMIDIAKLVAQRAGHQIDYAVLDWDQAKTDVRDGKYDCLVGAARSDVPDFSFPNEPLGKSTNVAYTMRSRNLKFATVKDIGKLTVGTAKDYSYGPQIDEWLAKIPAEQNKVVDAGSRPVTINMWRLIRGEVDVVIEDENVGASFISTLGLDKSIVNSGRLSEPDPLYVACGPKSKIGKTFVAALNEAIPIMRKNGELANILAKYNLQDWSK